MRSFKDWKEEDIRSIKAPAFVVIADRDSFAFCLMAIWQYCLERMVVIWVRPCHLTYPVKYRNFLWQWLMSSLPQHYELFQLLNLCNAFNLYSIFAGKVQL